MNHLEDAASKNYFALFPEEMIASVLDAFVINRPMNGKVGGDGFWVHRTLQHFYIVVFDCMGHGHFASMMTRIYTQALEEVIAIRQTEDPGQILEQLHDIIKTKFAGKKKLQVGSGADVGILKIDTLVRKIEYAGAKMDLMHVFNGELQVVKSDRLQIGDLFEYDHKYTTQNVDLDPKIKSNFYLSSDGLKDLIGGEEGKKFGKTQVKSLMEDNYQAPMATQKENFQNSLANWAGFYEPLDDMLVVGFSV